MKVKTCTVEIAGITRQPDETWMTQVARNLTDTRDGFLRGVLRRRRGSERRPGRTQNPNAVWTHSTMVYNRAIQAFVPTLPRQEGI
jgi:hypothetical protein